MDHTDSDSPSTKARQRPGDAQEQQGQPVARGGEERPGRVEQPVGRETRIRDRSWEEVRSAGELADLVSRHTHPIVVAFEDQDCHHCRAQRAMLSIAWDQCSWRVTTRRVDGRQLPQVADHYRITGYPTLLVFSAGQVVERLPGRRDAQTIIRRLAELTQYPCDGEWLSVPTQTR